MSYDYRTRYSKSQDSESLKTLKADHPSYASNLKIATVFVENIQKQLLPGMQVKISDSEHLKKSLLVFSWRPPLDSKRGTSATPIFLHQPEKDLRDSLTRIVNVYIKTVREFHEKQQLKLPMKSKELSAPSTTQTRYPESML